MAFFLFIDESGHDHHESPYEVLAGISIEDINLWNLIRSIHALELDLFGVPYRLHHAELKAKKLLNTKTFKKASALPSFELIQRRELAATCITHGANATRASITALAQAKLEYSRRLLELCHFHNAKIFASISPPLQNSTAANQTFLRKNHVMIFDRFSRFLEERSANTMGCIVFDELEKTQSRILARQMDNYFKRHAQGQIHAERIIPEPFFVHSDLTTGIQLADIVAYLVSWGFRFGPLTKPARQELKPFVDILKLMRYRKVVLNNTGVEQELWSTIAVFDQTT